MNATTRLSASRSLAQAVIAADPPGTIPRTASLWLIRVRRGSIREAPGNVSLETMLTKIDKLLAVRAIGLPWDLFSDVAPKVPAAGAMLHVRRLAAGERTAVPDAARITGRQAWSWSRQRRPGRPRC